MYRRLQVMGACARCSRTPGPRLEAQYSVTYVHGCVPEGPHTYTSPPPPFTPISHAVARVEDSQVHGCVPEGPHAYTPPHLSCGRSCGGLAGFIGSVGSAWSATVGAFGPHPVTPLVFSRPHGHPHCGAPAVWVQVSLQATIHGKRYVTGLRLSHRPLPLYSPVTTGGPRAYDMPRRGTCWVRIFVH